MAADRAELLPYLTALENVALPMILDGARDRRGARGRAPRARGLADRADHRPERLSGGEQQRVAIAVALANRPAVLLADEPTGELDSATSAEVFALLRRVNAELGATIVVVTHDALVSEQVGRTVSIRDGRTSTETVRRTEQTRRRHRVIAEEFAVLDRAGRLQLPRAHVDSLALRGPRPAPSRGGPRRRLARPSGLAPRERPRRDRSEPVRRAQPANGATRVSRAAGRRRDGAHRDYPSGDDIVHAVRKVDLVVDRGRLLAVRGRSGSGKTTLLNLLGGLDRPTIGSVV